MPLVIRSAALDDVPAILALERQSSKAAHWRPEQYNKLIDSGSGVVLVAEESAEFAPVLCIEPKERSALRGFIGAKAVVGEWEIENVVVAAEFLRRGIGDGLMRQLIHRAREEAACAILLEVRESNLPARGLYRKHRFRETGRRLLYYSEPREDAILYTFRFGDR